MKLALCVSTYNRVDYLKKLLQTYYATRNNNYNWTLYIADDGSNDGTIEYIKTLDAKIIILNRTGLCNSMNMLIFNAINDKVEYGFRCDDDIEFINSGWDDLYIQSSIKSGYDHLVFYDSKYSGFNKDKIVNNKNSIQTKLHNILDSHGAFFTFTPKLIESVGYFDNENFKGHGYHHIDFTYRACKAGFNSYKNNTGPWDALCSEEYITLYKDSYNRIRPKIDKKEKQKRINLLLDTNRRIYIPLRKGTVSRRFSSDWTTFYTENWKRWLSNLIALDNIHMLEVGCYEGRSSCWFCDNILIGNNCTLTCVDKFGKYKGKKIEPIFDNNISGLPVIKIKGESRIELAKLVTQKKKYHAIYLDADHHRTPALIDFVNCFQLLHSRGIIICDDFHYTGVRVAVSSAIKCFKYRISKIEKTKKIKNKRIQIAIWKK